jgi:hypothetical protein
VGYSPPPSPPPGQAKVLPGETFWGNGVSNYIFGTNDTGEWGHPNFEFSDSSTAPGTPNTAVQTAVKNAGFTFIRSFITHHDLAKFNTAEMSDAEIAARLNTIANSGAQCLGELQSDNPDPASKQPGDQYTDLQFAEHVVTLADGNHPGYAKCSIFEIGNELNDGNGHNWTMTQYLKNWNVFVTALKQIRPDAKFIGPVNQPSDVGAFLMGVVMNNYPLPDAVSWHWYPCGYGSYTTWPTCVTAYTSVYPIANEADQIRGYMQSILGYQLPLGISEWSADPGVANNLSLTEPQMSQFITYSLNAMVAAKLDFANEFDIQSVAAYGNLDMFDATNTPRPYFNAFANAITQYKSGSSKTPGDCDRVGHVTIIDNEH